MPNLSKTDINPSPAIVNEIVICTIVPINPIIMTLNIKIIMNCSDFLNQTRHHGLA